MHKNLFEILIHNIVNETFKALLGPLPANVSGYLFANAGDAYFAKTTIGNLANDNVLIWVHVVAGLLMYFSAYYFMRRFTTKHTLQQPDSVKVRIL